MIRDLINDYEKNFNNFKKSLIKKVEILELENKRLKKENDELQNKYSSLYIEFNKYKEMYSEKSKDESNNYTKNINESIVKLNEIIEREKDKFVNLSASTIKNLINNTQYNNYKIEFKEILKYHDVIEWLDEKEVNTILLISVFYNMYNEFVRYDAFKYVINDNSEESKFIRLLEEESSLNVGGMVDQPVYSFLSEDKRLLKDFDSIVLERVKVFINILFNKVVKKVNIREHQKVNCADDSGQLVVKPIFIKIKYKNNKIKYILKELNVCNKCNSAYILRKNLNKQNNYKILINEAEVLINNINKENNKIGNSVLNNIKEDKELKSIYSKLISNYKKNDNNALRKNVNSNKSIDKDDYIYLKQFDGNNLNEESELKKLGYSSTISRSERANILKNKAIPQLGKARVRSHIEWLINMNKNKRTMKNSVIEWSYDLDRLSRM